MPNIFPQSNTTVTNNIIISSTQPAYGKSPIFDFSTGEFKMVDGKVYIGEGVEVLKNWIEKTLRTERYRFPIYSFNYGVVLEELVAKDIPYELLVNELQNQITDALIRDNRITQVGNFKFARGKDSLAIEFEVTTFDNQVIEMGVDV